MPELEDLGPAPAPVEGEASGLEDLGPAPREDAGGFDVGRMAGAAAENVSEFFTEDIPRLVTGEGRTEFPDMPELGTSGPEVSPFSEEGMTMFGAYATSVDESAIADIAVKALKGAKQSEDKFGNAIITFKGKRYYVNKPGVSEADMFNLAAQVAIYAPAALRGATGKTVPKRMRKTATGMSTTSVAADVAAGELGSEQGISTERAVIAGVGGAAFEGLAPLAVTAWRFITRQPQLFNPIKGQLTERGRETARAAGLNPDDMAPELAEAFAREARDAVNPKHAANVAEGKQFDIRYTKGQAQYDPEDLARVPKGAREQLQKEEATRKGAFGEDARDTMREFDAAQADDIATARTGIQDRLGGGTSAVEREAAGGEIIEQGLARETRVGQQAVKDAYAEAAEKTAVFTGDSLSDLAQRAGQSVRTFNLDPELHPMTIKTMRDIAKLSKRQKKMRKNDRMTPLEIRDFEKLRRKMGSRINAMEGNVQRKADRAALIRVKGQLDKWWDDALDNALFSGDDEALAVLKKARGTRRDYGKKFEQQGRKDEAGRVIQKMIETEANGEQIVNYVLGMSTLGKGGMSGKIVQKLEKIFPKGTEEWNALREMTWLRLTRRGGENLSPTKYKKALGDAMDKARSLMEALFEPGELALMKSYRKAVLRTVTPADLTNPSKTAYNLAFLVRSLIRRTGTMFTFSGQPGLGAAFFTAARTPGTLGNRAARSATRGLPRDRPQAPIVPATGVAGTEELLSGP